MGQTGFWDFLGFCYVSTGGISTGFRPAAGGFFFSTGGISTGFGAPQAKIFGLQGRNLQDLTDFGNLFSRIFPCQGVLHSSVVKVSVTMA